TKTGWHDHLSGTVVVHGRPARPRWTEMGWQWMPQSTAPAPADGRVSPAAPAPRSPWTWTDVVPVLILFIPAALLGQLAVVVTLRATGVGRAHHAATSLALDVVAYAADLCLLWLFLGVRRRARLAD